MLSDPNFPEDLAIVASTRKSIKLAASRAAAAEGGQTASSATTVEGDDDVEDAAQDVASYGIAGRTWEAAYAMRMYLTPQPPSSPSTLYFDPPCPLFAEPTSSPQPRRTIIEIGSGTGYLSIALAPHLAASDSLVLTDLEEVGPLLSSNLDTAKSRWTAQGRPVKAEVLVRSLPWGDEAALRKLVGREEEGGEGKQADVVLASDLVYFPFLYPPLLRTLLGLTGMREGKEPTQVLFSYKIRSLVREQPFWSSFGRWFNFEAVLVASPPPPSTSTTASSSPDSSTPQPPLQWTRFGTGDEDELFVFVCVRKPSTYDWEVPLDDEELIQGGRGQDGVDDQFERMLLGGMEWD